MKRRRGVAILLTLLCGAPAIAHATPPARVGGETLAAFYGWVLAHPAGGIPGPADRETLAAILSPELIRLLGEAATAEQACVKSAPPDEKPLIVEGDLFTGSIEGAAEVAYGSERRQGKEVSVEVTLTHVDPRFPKGHRNRAISWTNRVVLRADGGRWIVADVHFARAGTLTRTLADYLADAARECK